MLDLVKMHLPIGNCDWEQVQHEYEEWRVETNSERTLQGERRYSQREGDALKKKFDRLCGNTKPTGDPKCPPEVKRAEMDKARYSE